MSTSPQSDETMPSGEGGRIPGTRDPAFELLRPRGQGIPVLIAAPHGGRNYPPELTANMREASWSKMRLEDRLVDRLAKDLAQVTGAPLLLAHAPRAMIDLNRATDDVDWTMVRGDKPQHSGATLANRRARSGLGLVPRRLHGLGEIWRSPLGREQLDERIETIHAPYHETLERALRHIRAQWGAVLLVDLHSMPPLRPRSAEHLPAEFVIGDRFGASCNAMLAATAIRSLSQAERRVAHNRPYSGGYVLDRHAAPQRGFHALQVEVCRSAYLDASLREAGPRMPGVVRLLATLIRDLAHVTASLGNDAALRQAAE